MPKLAILDGHSLAYRAFYALPADLATPAGQVTNAVFGFTSMLIKLLEDEHPDAVAVASAALMAAGCQQYRICHTGRCPMGITSQDPVLRARLDVAAASDRLARFLRVSTEELRTFARLTGKSDVHALSVSDLCTTSSEISAHTSIDHV